MYNMASGSLAGQLGASCKCDGVGDGVGEGVWVGGVAGQEEGGGSCYLICDPVKKSVKMQMNTVIY